MMDGFDLAPLLRIALLGLCVACGPLAWFWLRHRQASQASPAKRLQAMTLLTLFITFDLVMFGAFTRLTDSGLGCPDWPGCYGHASPLGADAAIAEATRAMPTGPVTLSKAWIEMLHRYMATAVGVLIVTLTLARWWEGRKSDDDLPTLAWPVFTLILVCAQGAFGALTVTMKLFPAIVTLHLLGGVALVAVLAAQAGRYGERMSNFLTAPRWLPLALCGGLAMLTVQIALGGWVSTNYAVLACQTFPDCNGSWWPTMDFAQGFTWWRGLGLQPDGHPIAFAALTAIHYVHRLMAYGVVIALGVLAWALWATAGLRHFGQLLAALLLLQVLTGLGNVLLGWPLLAAVLHTGGAAALAGVLAAALASRRLVR